MHFVNISSYGFTIILNSGCDCSYEHGVIWIHWWLKKNNCHLLLCFGKLALLKNKLRNKKTQCWEIILDHDYHDQGFASTEHWRNWLKFGQRVNMCWKLEIGHALKPYHPPPPNPANLFTYIQSNEAKGLLLSPEKMFIFQSKSVSLHRRGLVNIPA